METTKPTEKPEFTLSTEFGDITLIVQDGQRIYVRADQIEVNGVPYSLSLSVKKSGGGIDLDSEPNYHAMSLRRLDWVQKRLRNSDPTDAARRRVRTVLLRDLEVWAGENDSAFDQGALADLEGKIARAVAAEKEAVKVLEEARRVLTNLEAERQSLTYDLAA